MPTYAHGTSVPVDRSRAEIERTLQRYGASGFAYGWHEDKAMVGFVAHGRQIRFVMTMPTLADNEIRLTPTRRTRAAAEQQSALAQAVKQRWRSLALTIKAKLEAVESGIVTFEEEFATHVVLPDGTRVSEHLLPAIEQAYATGQVPPLLQIGRG